MASSTSSERVRCSFETSPVSSSGVTPRRRAISTSTRGLGLRSPASMRAR